MLVKYEGKIYRLPVRPALDREDSEEFKQVNQSCEVLLFGLEGGHFVAQIDSLEFHDQIDDRLH